MTSFLSTASTMRVGDAERAEVGELLSRHFADGRLDRGEFDERLEAAMRAKTRGDLDRLLTDLPRLAQPGAPAPRRGGLAALVLPLVTFLLFVLAVDAVAHSAVHVFAGWWVLLVLFFVLRRRGHRYWRHHRER